MSTLPSQVRDSWPEHLHFHDLRHSFASWFVMRGGSLQALLTILGHADIKMTLRYAHLAPDQEPVADLESLVLSGGSLLVATSRPIDQSTPPTSTRSAS